MDGIPFRLSLRSTNNKENEDKAKAKSGEGAKRKPNPVKEKMGELKKKYNNFGL